MVGWRQKNAFGSLGQVVRHPDYLHTFCGYYDRSPWSYDGKYLLVCCTNVDRLSDNSEPAHIFSFEISTGKFAHLSSTKCWNFQQSAQQQWCGPDQVLFNSEVSGKPIAQICGANSETTQDAQIPSSIGMVNRKNGLVALYDYCPMNQFEPDYGYKILNCNTISKSDRSHLRIVIWSLNEEKAVLTIGPDILNEIDANDSFSREGTRYLQHVKFNPSGTKIIFVLRSAHSSRKVPASSLYAFDLNSGEHTVLISTTDWRKGCNHPVWANDDEVIVNLFDDGFAARKFQLINSTDAQRRIVAANYDGIGHPTMCDDGGFILTDEYMADRSQILTRYFLPSGKRQVIGRFPAAKYPKGEDRCDLHPRYNASSKTVAVDHYDNNGRVVSLVEL